MVDGENEDEKRHRIQSIERGFAVLLAFDADLPRPTSTDLAIATGLSRPTVRRILITLHHLGYVAPSGTGGGSPRACCRSASTSPPLTPSSTSLSPT